MAAHWFSAVEAGLGLVIVIALGWRIWGVTRRFSVAPSVSIHVTTSRQPDTTPGTAREVTTTLPALGAQPSVTVKRTVYTFDPSTGHTADIPKELLDTLSPAQRKLVLEKVAELRRTQAAGVTGPAKTKA